MASPNKVLNQYLLQSSWHLTNKRLILPIIIFALFSISAESRAIIVSVLSDAFWQVSAYVAATLAVYHFISNRLNQRNSNIGKILTHSGRNQVLFAASMGALPGCGGAIVVITQYIKGQLSFGSVVAVLTATMGDAAFLLLAAQPKTGLFVIAVGFVVGVVSGLIIDKIHGYDFLRPEVAEQKPTCSTININQETPSSSQQLQGLFWKWMLIPASVIAIMGSLQVDIDQAFHLSQGTISIIGAIAAMVAMLLWATSRDVTDYQSAVAEDPRSQSMPIFQRVAQDTNFVSSWVIAAFLLFEFTIYWSGIDLTQIFAHWYIALPLMAVLIGLLPGCGPQILVTSLYLSGALPLSAQLGNSISNDGDALFPAIALAPKAALVATLYSSIPAIMVAYGYFFMFE